MTDQPPEQGVPEPTTPQPSGAIGTPPDAPGGGPLGWVAPAPQPAPRRRVSRRLLITGGIVVVAVVLAVVFRDRISGSAGDLRVGDCFDTPANMTDVKDVQHHPCTEAHDAEAVLVQDYPNATAYPGIDAFDEFVQSTCVPAWEAYTGRTYETDSELDIAYFYPQEQGWGSGDREVECFALRVDHAKLTSSVKSGS
jgi:hypothetical protein